MLASGTGPPAPRDQLAAIVESSEDAIISKDLDGKILTWNNAAQRIFGYSTTETVGQNIRLLIPENLVDEETKILSKIRRGERVEHYETTRRRKDGSMVAISLTVSPIKDQHGKIVGASKIARDITNEIETRKAIRELNATLEQRVLARTKELREAVTQLESFNAAVSHDLRTPLRAITGLLELLSDDTIPKSEQKPRLRLARASAAEMTQTVEALLRLSRIQRSQVNRRHTDLTSIVTSIYERLRAGVPTRKAELTVEPGLHAFADPGLVNVVLENLIGNAWKFTAKNPLTRIHVGHEEKGGRDRFYVRDNGVGFSEQEAATLFRPFHRIRPTEFEGLGIGLATVERAIHAHGGTVMAAAGPGAGATLWFDLGHEGSVAVEDEVGAR